MNPKHIINSLDFDLFSLDSIAAPLRSLANATSQEPEVLLDSVEAGILQVGEDASLKLIYLLAVVLIVLFLTHGRAPSKS